MIVTRARSGLVIHTSLRTCFHRDRQTKEAILMAIIGTIVTAGLLLNAVILLFLVTEALRNEKKAFF